MRNFKIASGNVKLREIMLGWFVSRTGSANL